MTGLAVRLQGNRYRDPAISRAWVAGRQVPGRAACLLLLAGLLILQGCASRGAGGEHYRQIVAASHDVPRQAWLTGDRLFLEAGSDETTVWLEAALSPAGQEFRHGNATLALAREPDKRGSVEAVPVQSKEVWGKLLQALLEALVPAAHHSGVAFLVNNQEVVVWRTEGGFQQAEYGARPAQVEVVNRLDDDAFSAFLFEFLAAYVDRHELSTRRALFVNPDGGRQQMAFLFVDLDRLQVVSIQRPWHAALEQLGEAPLRQDIGDFNSVLVKSQAVTLLKNPVTWLGRFSAWSVNTLRALVETPAPLGGADIVPLYQGPGMDLQQWERELDRFWAPDRYRGSIEFLVGGDQYFPRLLDAVRDAEKQVLMRTYIFDNDDYAVTVAEALRQRGEQGADVRVLYDDLGSRMAWRTAPLTPPPDGFRYPDNMGDYLTRDQAAASRAAPNPWLTGDHVKSTVIDGQRAFVGGMNVGREYRSEWHDLMMEIRGPVVERLERDFHRAWAHAGPGGDFALAAVGLFTPIRDAVDEDPEDAGHYIAIRPLYTRTFNAAIHRAQLRAIKRARGYIYIQNSYFSDNRIQKALIEARRRGVDVRVILPSSGNHGVMNSNNALVANRFIEHGIRVYAYPGMSHIKAAVYDGWACLGSANFDKLSLRVNQELNLAFSDPATVKRLIDVVFAADFARATEITEPLEVGLSNYFAAVIANQL